MFDDFLNNLQSSLSIGKMDEFYDFHIAKLRNMQEGQRRAHISSMKHSQKHDYKADLRLVITEDDDLHPGLDPWKLESYNTPGIAEAIQAATQIVIRRGGVEQKVKG
ncbi:hypothetical protein CC53_gp175 [Rhizobium phage vB_RleS_L338C]|uniref:hypothetical protein n=1 Tax=Rhizobium phage vB_RleS_L338C TaxID=1414737 RepID=UPI0003D90031|nr:hypothetical protein CC53_gp175 [Rhizobium phage vB_RleS_L338C]AHC30592.1 hypothetical protein L338C_175 [Rhizobium phage vB_RleS_L338C]QNH72141.1 hypothetical protein P11VFA_143 [Rhizobium phage P11VFA]